MDAVTQQSANNMHSMTLEAEVARRILQGTAYHEAGHAVVHLYFGLPIAKVSIVAAKDAPGHVAHPDPLMLECGVYEETGLVKQVARQMIIGAYAGIEAQRLVQPCAQEGHAESDFDMAFTLSQEFGVFPRHMSQVGDELHLNYLDRLRQRARGLVRGRLRGAIEALAAALVDQSTLSQEQAVQVVGDLI
jgi:hypothetical protein